MKLIEAYATHAGLKIDKPIIVDEFVPLPVDDYITLHVGGGQRLPNGQTNFPAKCYSFWQFVVQLLKEAGIKEEVVQIGVVSEPLIPGTRDMREQTKDFRKVNYVIKRAKLHMGNCSFPNHVAGALNIPVVSLYGPTTVANHAPYWHHPKSIFIESNRNGNRPSYASTEEPRTIDLIYPEEVANAVLSVLGYPPISIKTVKMGQFAHHSIVEYIPNFVLGPQNIPGSVPRIRMDYHFNEQNAFNFISQGKGILITDKELNLGALKQLKPNIDVLQYEVTNNSSLKYLIELKKIGLPVRFFSRAKDQELARLRLDFFDLGSIYEERENESPPPKATKFRTNKVILSEGKPYASLAHVKQKIELDLKSNSSIIIDDPETYREEPFYWFYNE